MRILVSLLCCFVVGCTTTPKQFQGTLQPEYAKYACPKENKQCFFNYDDNQGQKVDGFYKVEKLADAGYVLIGSARVDISETSKEYQKIKKLHLTFIFFQDDLVVHEEVVKLRGDLGKFIEFSQTIETSTDFESSKWASFKWLLSG
jgi:hypothetical protein